MDRDLGIINRELEAKAVNMNSLLRRIRGEEGAG